VVIFQRFLHENGAGLVIAGAEGARKGFFSRNTLGGAGKSTEQVAAINWYWVISDQMVAIFYVVNTGVRRIGWHMDKS